MSRPSIVTLVGARGSGKSAVARPLAVRLGFDVVDADEEIERAAGRSIREIFETDGEPEFRRIEREVIVELLGRERIVLASGGGAILDERTRRDLRAAGPVLWLRASAETLADRVASDATTGERRPSLTGAGVVEEIAGLLAFREPLYRDAATIVVDTEDRDPDAIADECFESVRRAFARSAEDGSVT